MNSSKKSEHTLTLPRFDRYLRIYRIDFGRLRTRSHIREKSVKMCFSYRLADGRMFFFAIGSQSMLKEKLPIYDPYIEFQT